MSLDIVCRCGHRNRDHGDYPDQPCEKCDCHLFAIMNFGPVVEAASHAFVDYLSHNSGEYVSEIVGVDVVCLDGDFQITAAIAAAIPVIEADLRARISALADEWEADARAACDYIHGGCPDCIGAAFATELRNLLDRPAAEGDERLAEAWDAGHADGCIAAHCYTQRGRSYFDESKLTDCHTRNPYRPAAAEGNENHG